MVLQFAFVLDIHLHSAALNCAEGGLGYKVAHMQIKLCISTLTS